MLESINNFLARYLALYKISVYIHIFFSVTLTNFFGYFTCCIFRFEMAFQKQSISFYKDVYPYNQENVVIYIL